MQRLATTWCRTHSKIIGSHAGLFVNRGTNLLLQRNTERTFGSRATKLQISKTDSNIRQTSQIFSNTRSSAIFKQETIINNFKKYFSTSRTPRHGGHAHDHSEVLEGKAGQRITIIGFMTNVLLCVGKGAAGWFGNSQAMIADAAHSLGDSLSDAITLWSHKLARKPKDQNYPFGYGKYEPLGAFVVSLLLIATGVGLTVHALEGIVGEHLGWELGHSHSHGHGGHGAGPTQIALYVAVASLVVNELLFRATLFIAKKERSQVLEANAWHHRSDAMSSGAAFIGIVGSMAGYPQFDPIASVVVSGMIIRAGFYIFTDVIRELTDRKMDHAVHDQLVAMLEQFKQQSNNGVAIAHDDHAHDEHDHSKCDEHNLADAHMTNHVIGYHTIRVRKMGPYSTADVYIIVDPNITVGRATEIAKAVRHAILHKIPKLRDIAVHFKAPGQHDDIVVDYNNDQHVGHDHAGHTHAHDHK